MGFISSFQLRFRSNVSAIKGAFKRLLRSSTSLQKLNFLFKFCVASPGNLRKQPFLFGWFLFYFGLFEAGSAWQEIGVTGCLCAIQQPGMVVL